MNTVNYAARRASAEAIPKSQRIRLAPKHERKAAAQDRKAFNSTDKPFRGLQLGVAMVSAVKTTARGSIGSRVLRIARKIIKAEGAA